MGKREREDYEYDRDEATRLLRDLLTMDEFMDEELLTLFKALDKDEAVQLDGLDKRCQKKLRHLFQSMKFTKNDKSWCRPNKIKVRKVLKGLLEEVKASMPKKAKVEEERELIYPTTGPLPGTGPASSSTSSLPKGPMRPTKEMLEAAARAKVVGSDDEDFAGESDEDVGPMPAGVDGDAYAARRKDLESLKKKGTEREEWMMDPGEALRSTFEPPGGKKGDRFAIKRSKAEEEAFEKAFKARGKSLMEEVHEGKFNPKDLKAAREKYDSAKGPELWGLSEQSQGIAGGNFRSGAKRSFDPDVDMEVPKPMSSDGFQKMLAEARNMNSRFTKSETATSFL